MYRADQEVSTPALLPSLSVYRSTAPPVQVAAHRLSLMTTQGVFIVPTLTRREPLGVDGLGDVPVAARDQRLVAISGPPSYEPRQLPRLVHGRPSLYLATCFNVLQRCLARQQASHTHADVWKRREHRVDEIPQFL